MLLFHCEFIMLKAVWNGVDGVESTDIVCGLWLKPSCCRVVLRKHSNTFPILPKHSTAVLSSENAFLSINPRTTIQQNQSYYLAKTKFSPDANRSSKEIQLAKGYFLCVTFQCEVFISINWLS